MRFSEEIWAKISPKTRWPLVAGDSAPRPPRCYSHLLI